MKLLNCHIENFGKLQNEDFNFSDGYNLFEKENGWGKSTLAAFIKVMFYGFDGERQRQIPDNERRKYQPWQGGPYGGSITFQLDCGKSYKVERIFADKPKDDSFSIRDGVMLTPVSDFSENLGEEVFHVDKDAFKRSFYISQGDGFTKATDGINAKIGGLFEQSDDIGNYEEVEESLKDFINNESPKRKTGRLYKISEQIARLKEKIRALSSEVDSIPEFKLRREALKERIDQINEETENVKKRQARYVQIKEQEAVRAKYEDAVDYYEKCKSSYEEAVLALSGSDATLEELASYSEKTDTLSSIGGRIEAEKLSDEAEGILSSPEDKKSFIPLILLIAGALAIVCGAVFLFIRKFNFNPYIPAALFAGLILILLSVILHAKNVSKKAAAANLFELYKNQKDRFEEACDEFDSLKSQIFDFLILQNVSLDEAPEEREKIPSYLRVKLDDLNQKLQALTSAKKELEAAKLARMKFENDETLRKCLDFEAPETTETADDFNRRLTLLKNEENELRHQNSELKNQLNSKNLKADDLASCKENLKLLDEEYEAGLKKHSLVSATREFLHTAKENFTAKFSSPVMEFFREYCQAISGEDASRFHVDSNSDITMDIAGMQRSSDFLSAGYKDLVGIALRIAFVDTMFPEEKPFIVMDDPLVNLDSTKADAAAAFIRKISENHQIIYFTCHSSRSI